MNHTNILVPQTEQRFTETVTHILHRHGFRSVPGAEAPADHGLWMEKDTHTYCVEIKYSRTRVFPTANAAAIYNRLEALWQTRRSWIPLVVHDIIVLPRIQNRNPFVIAFCNVWSAILI